MTLDQARKILGLGHGEDPRPHLAEFKLAREQIATLVAAAEPGLAAALYQQELAAFDQALAVVHQHLAATAAPTPAITRPRRLGYLLGAVAVLALLAAATWFATRSSKPTRGPDLDLIAALDRQGSQLIDNRRWQEASAVFDQIQGMAPDSELARRGHSTIKAGMAEEQTQFIGYWTGQATAEFEAGRLDEAVAAARQVLDKLPTEPAATALLGQVAAARNGQSRSAALASAREACNQRQWATAIATAQRLLTKSATDLEAKTILTEATAALEKAAANQQKALALLAQATARDNGQFDQQALDLLREANSLAPENLQISARIEKLAAYSRTLHVPKDFATPADALAAAKPNDRILLAAGTWNGPLVVVTNVEIQGAGSTLTRIECQPADGSVITIGPDAKEARISGVAFRHQSFVTGSERFSVALVRGGGATFLDCRFTEASGHGLAVIAGGRALASRSRFADNGWDGAAAIGAGSSIELQDCEALNNFEHGIESWDGAAATLVNNRCEGNSRNGIHADSGQAAAVITGNRLTANREFGLVLASAGSGKISANIARANLLGGFVIRSAAHLLPVTGNQATLNQGSGLILEKGLTAAAYTNNQNQQNSGPQLLPDTDLTAAPVPAPRDPTPPR